MSAGRSIASSAAGQARTDGDGALYYAYGIVPAELALGDGPRGIDESPIEKVEGGGPDGGGSGVAALVSRLDPAIYAPDKIESAAGEVEWIAPRAQAHDAVVSWASQPGPIIPLHMWTLFSDRDSVVDMLVRRAGELRSRLERLRDADEYGLRVFADAGALRVAAVEDEPTGVKLGGKAGDGPGRRYLEERKLEGARREAARALLTAAADAINARLGEHALEVAHDTIPRIGTAEAGAVLSSAYLVRRDRMSEFRRELTALVNEYEPRGFRFDFTGPWAPYHFVAGGRS